MMETYLSDKVVNHEARINALFDEIQDLKGQIAGLLVDTAFSKQKQARLEGLIEGVALGLRRSQEDGK